MPTTTSKRKKVCAQTDCQAFDRLGKELARQLEEVKGYFDLYEADGPTLWHCFQAANKVVWRSEGGGIHRVRRLK